MLRVRPNTAARSRVGIEMLEPRQLLTAVVFGVNPSTLSISQSTVTADGASAVFFAPSVLERDVLVTPQQLRSTISTEITDHSFQITGADIKFDVPPGTDYYNFGATFKNDVIEHHYTDLTFSLSNTPTNYAAPNNTLIDGTFNPNTITANLITGTLNYDNWSGPAIEPIFEADDPNLDGSSATMINTTGTALSASMKRSGNNYLLSFHFHVEYTYTLKMYYDAANGRRAGNANGPTTDFIHTLVFDGDITATAGPTTGDTGATRGTVFDDLDSSASFNSAEEGLPGVKVYLDDNANNALDSNETYVVTAANGSYQFPWRDAGSYRVRHVVPAGYRLVLPVNGVRLSDIIVGEVTSRPKVGNGPDVPMDFGDKQLPGNVAVSVFSDLNANGVKDSGEPGIAGLRVYVDTNVAGANNNTYQVGEAAATTDANGDAVIANVTNGNNVEFRVDFNTTAFPQLNNKYITTPTANNGSFVVAVPLPSPDDKPLFGITDLPGSIAGIIFADLNNNGTRQTGEAVLAGVRVFLDANNDSIYDLGETTVLTDATGFYSFDNLIPGTYNVREVLPTGYNAGTPSTGLRTITITANQDLGGQNFANIFVGSAVSGTIFNDANNNAVLDNGEAGIPGVTVYVDTNLNGRFDVGERSVVTDGAGAYTLPALKPGRRVIRHIIPTGYRLTRPSPIGQYTARVSTGDVITGVDFGDTNMGAVTGRVFNDANADGIQGAGEKAIRGWVVYADLDGDGTLDAGEPTAISDKRGDYNLAGLSAGTYFIRQEQHKGWRIVSPRKNLYTITVATNDLYTAKNFSNTDNILIGGNVFLDANGDGKKSRNNEAYAIGGQFTIFDDMNNNRTFDAGEVTAEVNIDGSWYFDQLKSGIHNIRIALYPGYGQTSPARSYYSLRIKSGAVVSGLLFGMR